MDREAPSITPHLKSSEQKELIDRIRQENAQAIATAIQQAGEILINQIDFNQEKDEYTVNISISLKNASDKEFANTLQMVFFSVKNDDDGTIRKRELGIFIALPNNLRTDVYLRGVYNLEITDEVAKRAWNLFPHHSGEKLNVISTMSTNKHQEGLGIGSSLLFSAEDVIEKIAGKIASISNYKFIEFEISDASDTGWTTRQMQKMPGYMYNSSRSNDINFWIKLLNKPF